MKVTDFNVNITTAQFDKMLHFYRDVVGLQAAEGMGEGALQAGPVSFFLDTHSEISGPAKEPARALLNFWVEDVAAEEARLEAAGVTFIRKQGKEFWGGTISTFLDPDGNYCQLMSFNPAEATEEAAAHA